MLFLPHGSDETNTLVFSLAIVGVREAVLRAPNFLFYKFPKQTKCRTKFEISNKIYEPLFRSDFLFGEDKVINFDFINVAISVIAIKIHKYAI